ncbi:Rad2 nuclease [Porites harrisoni]
MELEAKANVESFRRRNREESRDKGLTLWRQGRKEEAKELFKKAVNISNDMALKLMEVTQQRGIKYLVAPFEVDAQLAYLNKEGYADVVITEDSDLLVFGCTQVLFKMNHSGSGKLIKREDLNSAPKFKDFTFEKFRHMCILSRCDYASSIRGIGLQRA